jgi:hypothetical protein
MSGSVRRGAWHRKPARPYADDDSNRELHMLLWPMLLTAGLSTAARLRQPSSPTAAPRWGSTRLQVRTVRDELLGPDQATGREVSSALDDTP